MKRNFLIISLLFFFIISSKSQQNDSVMTTLLGKWNWFQTDSSQGGSYTPIDVGYTRKIVFYQNTPDFGTDSLNYQTYKDNSIIASGMTYIGNIYDGNSGAIFANIVLFDTAVYNSCNYCVFKFEFDSSLTIYSCWSDYWVHHYKKERLYDSIYHITYFNGYPNPAYDNLTIEAPPPAVIEITNIEGQVIEQQTTNFKTTNIDVSAFAKGMYFVKVKTEKGVESRKFVKL